MVNPKSDQIWCITFATYNATREKMQKGVHYFHHPESYAGQRIQLVGIENATG